MSKQNSSGELSKNKNEKTCSFINDKKEYVNSFDILSQYYPSLKASDNSDINDLSDWADWNNTEWDRWGDFGKFNNVL